MDGTIKGEFYPNKQEWIFKLGNSDTPFMTYLMEDVPIEVMDYFAQKHGKVQGSINDLNPDQKENIVEWFQTVFGTKEFGEKMINWIKADMNNLSEAEVEERFKNYSTNPISVSDETIVMEDVGDTPDEQKLESVLATLDIASLKDVVSGVLNRETWAYNFLKKNGVVGNVASIIKPILYRLGSQHIAKQQDYKERKMKINLLANLRSVANIIQIEKKITEIWKEISGLSLFSESEEIRNQLLDLLMEAREEAEKLKKKEIEINISFHPRQADEIREKVARLEMGASLSELFSELRQENEIRLKEENKK